MNLATIGRWLFMAGVLLATVAGLFGNMGINYLPTILIILGLIVGILNVTSAESRTFLIAGIAFLMTASALNSLPHVGEHVSAIASNLAAFTAPAVLLVALKSLLTTMGD